MDISKLLLDAEQARELPAGLLSSIMHQETGGKQDYIADPAKYHYPLNKHGKRVAGHTGKISTAFGPFGILESTGAKPGYGVAPLKDKSMEEQVRFVADYIGARIKSAGGVRAGLAGYGEGDKYADSVLSRVSSVPPEIPRKGAIVPKPIPQVPGKALEAPVESVYSVAQKSTVPVIQPVTNQPTVGEPPLNMYRGLADELLARNSSLQKESDALKTYYERAAARDKSPATEHNWDVKGLADSLANKTYGFTTNIGNKGLKGKDKLNFAN